MELRDALDPAIIDLAVKRTTKGGVLQALTRRLLDAGYIGETGLFLRDIHRREADGPTGMGREVAIPHGKSAAARKLGVAIARTTAPVRWESAVTDNGWQDTRLVFLFCVPDDEAFAQNHMALLGALARQLDDRPRLERLKACESVQEWIDLLLADSETAQ